jgi:digeranylgeranylglycerophospholipid reductase
VAAAESQRSLMEDADDSVDEVEWAPGCSPTEVEGLTRGNAGSLDLASEKWDIIVVGAGPAGSSAALSASERGLRTLVLDKRSVVGVPYQCGEYMPTNDEVKALLPKVENVDALFDIPGWIKKREWTTTRCISPKGRHYDLPFAGYSTSRAAFDQFLAARAMRAGAVFAQRRRVVDAGDGWVKTYDGLRLEAPVIVGADGPHSVVRDKMGIKAPRVICPSIYWDVKGNFEGVVDLYFGSVAPGGYAWMIPKADGANIGLGVQPQLAGRVNLKPLMDAFAKKYDVREVCSTGGGWVPASGPIRETVRGKTMLAGDSAGMVMASNGGGVCTAMISGDIAGHIAADHLRKGRAIADYEREWRTRAGPTLKWSLHTKKLADIFFRNDRTLEFIMRAMGRRTMLRALACRPLLGVY